MTSVRIEISRSEVAKIPIVASMPEWKRAVATLRAMPFPTGFKTEGDLVILVRWPQSPAGSSDILH